MARLIESGKWVRPVRRGMRSRTSRPIWRAFTPTGLGVPRSLSFALSSVCSLPSPFTSPITPPVDVSWLSPSPSPLSRLHALHLAPVHSVLDFHFKGYAERHRPFHSFTHEN